MTPCRSSSIEPVCTVARQGKKTIRICCTNDDVEVCSTMQSEQQPAARTFGLSCHAKGMFGNWSHGPSAREEDCCTFRKLSTKTRNEHLLGKVGKSNQIHSTSMKAERGTHQNNAANGLGSVGVLFEVKNRARRMLCMCRSPLMQAIIQNGREEVTRRVRNKKKG